MGTVVANHTLETLRDIRDSIKFYLSSKNPSSYSEAIKQEKRYYRDVLAQT
jgi:hypothetical protein